MSCQHGNPIGFCDECKSIDDAYKNGYNAGLDSLDSVLDKKDAEIERLRAELTMSLKREQKLQCLKKYLTKKRLEKIVMTDTAEQFAQFSQDLRQAHDDIVRLRSDKATLQSNLYAAYAELSTLRSRLLIGSNTLPSIIDIDGVQVPLGDVVRYAFEHSKLSETEWNNLPYYERDKRLFSQVEFMRKQFNE